MKNKKNHLKVLSTLSVAASDAREDTLSSIIIRTVFVHGVIKLNELAIKIKEEFNFIPYEEEILPLTNKLSEQGKINISNDVLSLDEKQKSEIQKLETSISDQDQSRFLNFKFFITDVLEEDLKIKQIKLLWSIFLKYLYDSFYEYGHEAIKTLHPYMDDGNDNNGSYEDILQKAIIEVKRKDKSLIKTFKRIVERFPDFASEKDLEFLNDLAQKTLSFTSLGLKPELADETINHNLVDWILYLDTNILYSILGLHSHPENESCNALINLIKTNSEYIKIKLRYTEQTYQELGSKKDDFKLLDDKMSDSSIKALLKTEKLDDFSSKFYQDLLEKRESTIHPSKVIELSQRTLKTDMVEIGRTGKRLEKIGNDYIDSRIVDYYKFIENKNRVKEEFCVEKGVKFNEIYRSERQVRHDVSLREIVLDSRKIKEGEELTLNNAKYFALTLDGLLISYDKYNVKNYSDERSFPVFFKPSYLLNKLVKVLPIKTVDYKKAFIKAITTKGFYKNTRKSDDILKIVNYLKSKGINDEKVIYNLISEDIFLEKFREKSTDSSFNQGEFIESRLNLEFRKKEQELETTLEELEMIKFDAVKFKKENEQLGIKKEELSKDLEQYKSALSKVASRVKDLENKTVKDDSQTHLNFEAAEQKVKYEEILGKNIDLKRHLKREIEGKIEDYKQAEFKKWQNKIWWNLLWVIPLLIVSLLLIIPNDFFYIAEVDEQGNKDNRLGYFVSIVAFLINIFFFNLIKIRFFNERDKSAKLLNIKVPEEFRRNLEDLD
ncbi:hypothetical protein [Tenacibaculum sp. Ill]|uniref:hypothetical protein n=1 Tax=Tenacibaculum sp. Ill TaxID=3445935 RepID=UPI003F7A44C3